jgi:hypothetical protein
MKLTQKQFFESLNWHEGQPPLFEEPSNSQIGFHATYFDDKVIAFRDNCNYEYIVGDVNKNFCCEMCKECIDQLYEIKGIPCVRYTDIVAWAEFYKEDSND